MANRRGKSGSRADFLFLGSKHTVEVDCSHEMKRCLFLGRKAMTNLDNILKHRAATLTTKEVLRFFGVKFQDSFLFSSFTLIKRFFSSSSFSAIRVVSSTYLRLLIVLLAILIPACDSSSPAFHMMYSAEKLNKQSDNIQPCRTPFLIFNQSVVPCLILAIASCFAYRFLRRQVRWSGSPISLRIFHILL